MAKTFLALALALQALAGTAAQAAGAKAAGMAVFTEGAVSLRRPAEAAVPLAVGERLYLGDIVETGPASRASLVLLYGSEIRINENTALELIPGAANRDAVKVGKGQVWTRLLHHRGGLSIRTPAAVCAVRGTEADVDQGETLTVKVYEGLVDVSNAAGKISLRAGQMVRVAGPQARPGRPFKVLRALVGDWQEGATSPDIQSFLERLEAGGAEGGTLQFNVGGKGGRQRDVRIRLKKKDAGAPGGR